MSEYISSDVLAEEAKKYIDEDRIKIKSIEEAIKSSIQEYKDRAIFIVGSFYVYKKVTEII